LIHHTSDVKSGNEPEAAEWEATVPFILQTCDFICQHCFLSNAPIYIKEEEKKRRKENVTFRDWSLYSY
jgi:hypothetical protein